MLTQTEQADTKTEQADHHLGVGGTGQMYGVGCVHTLPSLYFGFRKEFLQLSSTAFVPSIIILSSRVRAWFWLYACVCAGVCARWFCSCLFCSQWCVRVRGGVFLAFLRAWRERRRCACA